MTVSVVLVAYNRAHLLRATVESILAQTLKDFELIISDDCSSDETERVGREYQERDPRVRYRRNEKNLGMPENLNAGIREASGEYIANLHDGDLYDPRLLEKWAAALDRCKQAAFVFNAYRTLDPDGRPLAVYREPLPGCAPGSLLLEHFFFKRWHFDSPVWGTVMARRSAYAEVGPFDPRFGFYADVDMWMKLAARHHVAYVDEPLIDLPSRKTVPRLFKYDVWQVHRTLEQIFWEARARHCHGRPWRLAVEYTRHHAFSAVHRGYLLAIQAKRQLWRQRAR